VNEHVLIIGVGPGIGASVARVAARRGAQVTLVARSEAFVSELTRELVADGVDAAAVVADAAFEPGLTAALAGVVAERGAPTLLVYNAVDPTPPGLPSQLDPEAVTMALETNVIGAVVAAMYLIEPMRAASGGTLMFTGGILATRPFAAYSSLSVGKAALRAYALCLHQELRNDPQLHAVTVTVGGTVAPGGEFDPDAIAERMWQAHEQRESGRVGEITYAGSARERNA